ncbi:MAG: tRNA 2-thiouridine(34) synthase MnmA, partial [Candidatus Eisenbacteria bacterium]
DAATPRSCCSLDAIADARSVALHMGFPHHVLDESAAFRAQVVTPFVKDYLAGETPYPCSLCNTHLKFGSLFAHARKAGADFLATGHYARIAPAPRAASASGEASEPALYRAAHDGKDQTYALWGIARATLPRLLFPLGGLTKDEVRAHGERLGLARVAQKLESQDLCFVPDGDYAGFVAREAGAAAVDTPGPMLDPAGRVVGEHRGLAHYTVGQRKGLGIAAAEPQYVIGLEPASNSVRIGPESGLLAREVAFTDLNWLPEAAPVDGRAVEAQIRYRHRPAPARLLCEAAGRGRLVFDEPQRAITPGQSVVFYDGDRLLGGARIRRPGPPAPSA